MAAGDVDVQIAETMTAAAIKTAVDAAITATSSYASHYFFIQKQLHHRDRNQWHNRTYNAYF